MPALVSLPCSVIGKEEPEESPLAQAAVWISKLILGHQTLTLPAAGDLSGKWEDANGHPSYVNYTVSFADLVQPSQILYL